MSRSHIRSINNQKGQSLAEFAGSLVILIPMIMVLAYLSYIVADYFIIKGATDTAARVAARYLAMNYNNTAGANFAGNYNSTTYYSFIKIQNVVQSTSQFTNGSVTAGGQFINMQPTPVNGITRVAVQVQYPGGSGLPYWPNPNPSLFGVTLWPFGNQQISSFCVYDVEP